MSSRCQQSLDWLGDQNVMTKHLLQRVFLVVTLVISGFDVRADLKTDQSFHGGSHGVIDLLDLPGW